MKLISLKGQNLNSLYGSWAIDFSESSYANGGLFLIEGPTGSGKSTLIDAICLALFGRTPRINGISASTDPILSQQADQARAELTFEHNGHIYTSIWSHRRARKGAQNPFGQVQRELHEDGKLIESSITSVGGAIKRLLGLEFEQFVQAIVLAQGAFDSFLSAKDSDRAKILSYITGETSYKDISKAIYIRYKELDLELKNLIAQRNELSQDDPEEIQAKETRLKELKAAEEKTKAALASFEQLATLLSALKSIDAKIRTERQDLAQAQQSSAELEIRVAEENTRIEAYQPSIKQLDELEGVHQERKKKHTETHEALSAAIAQKEKAERDVKEHLASINASAATLKEIETQLAGASKEAQVYEDREMLSTLREAYIQAQNARAQSEEHVRKQLKAISAKFAHTMASLSTEDAYKLFLHSLEQAATQLAHREEELRDYCKNKEAQALLAEIEDRLDFIKATNALETERALLKEGDPCPLCGSCEHQLEATQVANEATELKTQKAKLTELIAAHKIAQEKQQLALAQKDLIAESHKSFVASLAAHKTEEARIAQKIQELGYVYTAEDFASRLPQIISSYATLKASRDEKTNELKLKETQMKEVELRASQAQEKHKETEALAAEAKQAYEELLAKLKSIDPNGQLRQNYEKLLDTHKKSEQALKLAQNRIASLSGSLESSAGYKNENIKKISELDLAVYNDELEAALYELNNEAGITHAITLSNELRRELRAEATSQDQECNSLILYFNQLREKERKITELNKEIAHTKPELQTWGELNKIIGSSDGALFEKLAHEYTFDILVHRANKELARMDSRYRILRAEGSTKALERVICDSYQDNKLREMNTLSGGESFLVSLSLALGLASLASGDTQMNFLFLDEGFGTLDSDSLDMAISCLDHLRASGKLVGIISHVERLKETIPLQIAVRPLAHKQGHSLIDGPGCEHQAI